MERELTVIAPGHFHAALVQKHKIEGISDNVHVYAPEGAELNQYTDFIDSFNGRADEPTSWNLDMHITDAPEADIPDSEGGVVVLAGKNNKKVDYIAAAIEHGYNVLTDKPMTIDMGGFEKLEAAYAKAKEKGLVIYDLMTERYDVLNIITRMLIADKELFGEMKGGDDFAVKMSSTHHFYKEVDGKPNIRPQWYYDTDQQGTGIADVTTHLIDLIFWQCFPDEAIDWKSDISMIDAQHFPSFLSPGKYKLSTGALEYPEYLLKDVENDILGVKSNGTMAFKVKNMPVYMTVLWEFEAPKGEGDTFTAQYNGTKATIDIRQDYSTGYSKEIFIKDFESREVLHKAVDAIAETFPFVKAEMITSNEYHLIVPAADRTGHEEHFSLVAGKFLNYVNGKEDVPEWEYANTLAKYRITAEAVKMGNEQ